MQCPGLADLIWRPDKLVYLLFKQELATVFDGWLLLSEFTEELSVPLVNVCKNELRVLYKPITIAYYKWNSNIPYY